ncbi:2-phosphosulfolactate phosphatase [Marinilabilia salmonicolor]|uniref:2-phosphosulfolactate phosphatase n=1 Tax=Marinilabilia salmonicolor TaxID=989 RepID=UPI000299F2F3|nr:2-phosphosulfolactate phosphatase [Marinilabilia salmonicolor]
MQTIDVINSVTELSDARVAGKTAVVIDVLRATSVMVTALFYGAEKVIPVLSKEEAFSYRLNNSKETVILAGERDADPIEGFDMGNSPLELIPEKLSEATLVMTTTNGTKAIRKAQTAGCLFIASFLNARATANALTEAEEVVLIASGTNGAYSLEDVLCAGYMVELFMQQGHPAIFTDAALGALNLYENNKADFPGISVRGRHYNILKQKGREKDLDYCFRRDVLDIVCVRNGEKIVLRSE